MKRFFTPLAPLLITAGALLLILTAGMEIVQELRAQRWVADAAVRVRDLGQVFQVEAFVVPDRRRVRVADVDAASEMIAALDWKVQDVVVIPVSELPAEADDSPMD